MNTRIRTFAAAALLACAPFAWSTEQNPGQANVAAKIAANFTHLAGSEENALALVNALRAGDKVTLVSQTTGSQTPATTTFTPPTGKMGWGNVKISLGLAQDTLLRAGIMDPTAEQLQAALVGGDIIGANGNTTTLKGVLQMRADGMGWGQIAHASGTKLGPVMSSLNHPKAPALPPSSATTKTSGVTTATSTTVAASATRGVTTAAGVAPATASAGHGRGIVTAAGGGSMTVSAKQPRGVVTASGVTATSTGAGNGRGNGNGNGNANGRGKNGG